LLCRAANAADREAALKEQYAYKASMAYDHHLHAKKPLEEQLAEIRRYDFVTSSRTFFHDEQCFS